MSIYIRPWMKIWEAKNNIVQHIFIYILYIMLHVYMCVCVFVGHFRRRSRGRMGGPLRSAFRSRSLINSRGCQSRKVADVDTRHHQVQREDGPSALREPAVLQSGSIRAVGSMADRRTQSVRLYLWSVTGVLPDGGGCSAGDARHHRLAERRGPFLSRRLHGERICHQPGTSP